MYPSKCFKPFYRFLTIIYIYIYIFIYIYTYIYLFIYTHTHTHTHTHSHTNTHTLYLQPYRYLDFYVNLHLACCVSPSSTEGFLLQKELPKMLFMEETFGENLWRGVYRGTNDQII